MIRLSHDSLIFIMETPYLERPSLNWDRAQISPIPKIGITFSKVFIIFFNTTRLTIAIDNVHLVIIFKICLETSGMFIFLLDCLHELHNTASVHNVHAKKSEIEKFWTLWTKLAKATLGKNIGSMLPLSGKPVHCMIMVHVSKHCLNHFDWYFVALWN